MGMGTGGGGDSYFLRITCNTIKGPRLQYFNKNKQTKMDTNKGSNKRHTYVMRNATAEGNIFCVFKLSIEKTILLTRSAKHSTFLNAKLSNVMNSSLIRTRTPFCFIFCSN
jgi:hypothetical protein